MNTTDEATVVREAAALVRDRFDGVVDARTALASRAQFLERAAPRKRGFGALAFGLAGALACVAIWASWPATITVTPQGVVLGKNGGFAAAATTPALLAFSDGSQLKIAPGSSGQLDRLDKHGADLRVLNGHLELSVVKKKQARWAVWAGPYRVAVTGTRFSVDWNQTAQRFSIQMIEGHVLVDGPSLPQPRSLGAGEFLQMEPPQPQDAPPPLDVPAANAVIPERQAPPTRVLHQNHAPAITVPSDSWAALVAKGKYADVLAQARGRNLTRVLAQGSVGELAALADASRYGGEVGVAMQALQAQRKRFAGSQQAVLAAYLLGRLAEDAGQSAQAVLWYDRYMLSPGALPLAEESLGRKMLALQRAGDVAAAAKVARLYKQRYPQGTFFDAASRVQSAR